MGKELVTLGVASGLGAGRPGCGKGPEVCQNSPYLTTPLAWQPFFSPSLDLNKLDALIELNCSLAKAVQAEVRQRQRFLVIGGDHSCAIGTWSGAAAALREQGPMGLLWIDAHLDAHTPVSTPSGNLHGMPVACLLGNSDPRLTKIGDARHKVEPQNICLVGIRSYEPAEYEFLHQLGVKIFFIEDIERLGLDAVLRQAHEVVTARTVGYGITLDLDSIDPEDAPGTGTPVQGGINGQDLCRALHFMQNDPKRIGLEIVEFDPEQDINHKTEKLLCQLIAALA